MTLGEFKAMALIASFFPLQVASQSKWTEFHVLCNDCSHQIPDDCTRGDVTPAFRQGGYRDASSLSYRVIAHGLCPRCDVLTTADYTLHSDMTCTTVNSKTGVERRFLPERRRLTWYARLMERVRTTFGKETR